MNTAVISASTTGRRSCQRKIYRPITCMRVCRTAWHYKTTLQYETIFGPIHPKPRCIPS